MRFIICKIFIFVEKYKTLLLLHSRLFLQVVNMEFKETDTGILIENTNVPEECKNTQTPNFRQNKDKIAGLPLVLQKHACNIDVMYKGDQKLLTYVSNNNINRFMLALHEAYDKHKSFIMCPSTIWTLICHGWIIHVKSNPELYRSKFVEHAGAKSVEITRDDFQMGDSANDFEGVFEEINELIKPDIGNINYKCIICNYMCSDSTTKCGSIVEMMSLLDEYYEFTLTTNCGIRKIHLNGKLGDWKKILYKVRALAEYDLNWWSRSMIPILEKIISTYNGEKDNKFWNKIYSYNAPGDNNGYVNGWINVFFPFKIKTDSEDLSAVKYEKNPLSWHWSTAIDFQQHGTRMDQYPLGVVVVNFNWKYKGETKSVKFYSGFLSTVMESDTDALKGQVGYMIKR